MGAWINTLYMMCAVIGGTILVIQTILLVVVGGGPADSDLAADVHDGDLHHGDSSDDQTEGHADASYAFLKMLSFKTVVAFMTFFGLSGLAGNHGGIDDVTTLLIAIGAGSVALYLVHYLMNALSRLQSQGNLDLRNAVGKNAKVYLRVPKERSGQGKVLVSVQGRKVECKAVTPGPEIPTGAEVRIVGISRPDTVDVLAIERESPHE